MDISATYNISTTICAGVVRGQRTEGRTPSPAANSDLGLDPAQCPILGDKIRRAELPSPQVRPEGEPDDVGAKHDRRFERFAEVGYHFVPPMHDDDLPM